MMKWAGKLHTTGAAAFYYKFYIQWISCFILRVLRIPVTM